MRQATGIQLRTRVEHGLGSVTSAELEPTTINIRPIECREEETFTSLGRQQPQKQLVDEDFVWW